MTTRDRLRASVRAELNDTAGVSLWADSPLNGWRAQALREYSRALLKAVSQSITTVADQADYALAADCLRVARVEHPSGFFRIPDPLSAGDVQDPFAVALQERPVWVSSQLAYELWGPLGALTLTLRPAPTASGET